jgi:CheY-like chemotaxis protein
MAELLIVDDNVGLRESMSTYFENKGHHLQTADGVGTAMDRIRAAAPDVVLSDLIMEDGTGLGLRDQIKQMGLKKEPYFILLTGHANLDNAREAYHHGVDLYLTKPFQMPALALAVDNALKAQMHMPPPLALSRAFDGGDPARIRAQADAFYHEFFLTLNPVLPRLLLLLEGRYGGLQSDQLGCISSIFDTWRKLVWTMADFHERLADPGDPTLERMRWHGPAALRRILDRLEPDMAVCQLSTEVRREPRLPLAWVHGPTAEAILEAGLLRLASFSAPGAVLSFSWVAGERGLELQMASDKAHPELTPELMRNVALLPPLLPLLEQAGVSVQVQDNAGPWTLMFDLA